MQEPACRLAFVAILLSVLVFSGAVSAFGATPEDPPFEILSATLDAQYDGLLRPQEHGWLGADGASSVSLGKRKTLWLFGDTILGTMNAEGARKGIIVRNTIGIHDSVAGQPGETRFYWDLSDNIPGSFLMGEAYDQKFWYWPMCGAMAEGELYCFLAKMIQGSEPGGLDFQVGGTTLLRVSNPLAPPHRWRKTLTELNLGDNHQAFCSAVYVEKPYFYLFGFDDGPEDHPLERRMVLARAGIRDLKRGKGSEAFEFWVEGPSGKGWSREPENLVSLFTPGVTESSIEYRPEWGHYLCVTHYPLRPEIYLVTAPALTGPWSPPVPVYEVPELARNKNYHAYAMKSHPELAPSPDELVITYVVNTTDFWSLFSDPEIYYPRFVRVKLRWKGERPRELR